MLSYKVNIIEELKKAGYNTYKIRKEKLLTQSALTAIRSGDPIHWTTLEKICDLLNCQPSDILENKKPLE